MYVRTLLAAWTLAGCLMAADAAADAAPDYAREQRWAAEIEPAIVVGDPVWLSTGERNRVLAIITRPVGTPQGGIVLVHGVGVHPDFGVIGALRTALAERGFVTLSVQMPVLAAGATRDDYRSLVPLAGDRIDAAVVWLRGERLTRIGVVAHSMGALMANAWLARPSHAAVDAFVALGMFGDLAPRLPPTLDIVAERDFPDVLAHYAARSAQRGHDRCSSGAVMADTDHYLGGTTADLAGRIASFLTRSFSGGCTT